MIANLSPCILNWSAIVALGLAGCTAGTHLQHYDSGRVVFLDHPNPPNERYTVEGPLDVTVSESYVKVLARNGTYLIPRERLIYVGPVDPADAVVVPTDVQGVTSLRESSQQVIDKSRNETVSATLFYIGSDHEYDYYRLVAQQRSQTYRILRKENAQEHRMPFTSDIGRWQRLQTPHGV